MSGLNSFLSPDQLAKHYETMRYLSQNPNKSFTIAQLDFLLPRGASLERFPREWLNFIRDGGCAHYSVRLDSVDDAASGQPQDALRCDRPTVETVEALRKLLPPPGEQLDADDYVGLHTDQIVLPPALLYRAQRDGSVYYFPAQLSKAQAATCVSAGRGFAAAAPPQRQGGSSGGGAAPSISDDAADEFLSQCASGGIPHTLQLNLPPGVRISHQLITHRGVVIRDEHCFPLRLRVGERLAVVLDNTAAVRLGLPEAGHSALRVAVQQNAWRRSDTPESTPPPLHCQQRAVAVPVEGSPQQSATRVRLNIVPCRATEMKLCLSVNDAESIIDLTVSDYTTVLPGVLIGRERFPRSFDLPPSYVLSDPVVYPRTTAATTTDTAAEAPEEEATEGTALPPPPEKRARGEAGSAGGGPSHVSVLPWWQSPSPLAGTLRELVMPGAADVEAAAAMVYTAESRAQEARLAKLQAEEDRRLQEEEQEANRNRRRRRPRSGVWHDISNLHMIHYGLDLSRPYQPPPPSL